MYINTHSNYSLRYGTLPVNTLVQQAKQLGVEVLALTDINASTAVFDFVKACWEHGIKPVIGMEFRDARGELLYIGLARNASGFKALNMFLSEHHITKTPLPETAPAFDEVYVVYPFDRHPTHLRENEYIGVRIEHLNKLIRPEYAQYLKNYVIHHPVTYGNAKEYELHKVLRAIDYNTLLSKLEPWQYGKTSEYMLPIDQLLKYYENYPRIAENTQRILTDCSFDFDFSSPKNKKYYTNSRYSDLLLLERLANEGLERRYGKNHAEAQRRVKRELEIIDKLCFSGYFLITWDVIRYSQCRGLYHVGRGSGANSIVSYCLGITDVDPIELDLYFERFLNPSRTSPPDFDIDWSHRDRDDILDYIFRRFDTQHTAFTGTIGTFKYRSTTRELGKVFGLPKAEIDKLSKGQVQSFLKDPIVHKIHHYGKMLERFPNMLSMHSCGILISEEPITTYTALNMPPKGFRTAQIDMYIAEDIGFEKLDILSQRGIGHLNDCVTLIHENREEEVDIHAIEKLKNDPDCNLALAKGNTLGCFYIESPAMRGLLRRLKCDNYKVLVAASSVIRPGVAKSGMMREYIFRHNNPTDFTYPHPKFETHLGETYGIMVYQEDVIKVAHHFAGLDLSDADILRRAMSGKTRSKKEFDGVRDRYFENCKALGHPEKLTQEVYRQIESFAGYSFCKAHSASYSVESYQSLYLKVHYPLEFMVAVINNFGGFYRTEIYFHEAKRAGATIHNPCVNTSVYYTSLHGTDIYVGFVHLKSLKSSWAHRIVQEREAHGAYQSFDDFVCRTGIDQDQLQILIRIGAFRFTGELKSSLTVQTHLRFNGRQPQTNAPVLFQAPSKQFKLPVADVEPFEDVYHEIELLGFPVSCSPFDMLKTAFRGDVMAAELTVNDGKVVRMLAYLVAIKHVPTAKGLMNFGTWVDAEGNYFDTTHFPKELEAYPFSGPGCYLLLGKVVVDFDFPNIEITKMARMPMIPDPRYEANDRHATRLPATSDNSPGPLRRKPYPSASEVRQLFGR